MQSTTDRRFGRDAIVAFASLATLSFSFGCAERKVPLPSCPQDSRSNLHSTVNFGLAGAYLYNHPPTPIECTLTAPEGSRLDQYHIIFSAVGNGDQEIARRHVSLPESVPSGATEVRFDLVSALSQMDFDVYLGTGNFSVRLTPLSGDESSSLGAVIAILGRTPAAENDPYRILVRGDSLIADFSSLPPYLSQELGSLRVHVAYEQRLAGGGIIYPTSSSRTFKLASNQPSITVSWRDLVDVSCAPESDSLVIGTQLYFQPDEVTPFGTEPIRVKLDSQANYKQE